MQIFVTRRRRQNLDHVDSQTRCRPSHKRYFPDCTTAVANTPVAGSDEARATEIGRLACRSASVKVTGLHSTGPEAWQVDHALDQTARPLPGRPVRLPKVAPQQMGKGLGVPARLALFATTRAFCSARQTCSGRTTFAPYARREMRGRKAACA
jgi:hypothetical protein